MGGPPQCRLSILRNGDVPCRYFLNVPVDFKIVQYRLSILRKDNVPCRYFSNVPVDFKVVQCRLLNLRKRCVALLILRVKGPIVGTNLPPLTHGPCLESISIVKAKGMHGSKIQVSSTTKKRVRTTKN